MRLPLVAGLQGRISLHLLVVILRGLLILQEFQMWLEIAKETLGDIVNSSANLLFSFSLKELSMSAGNVSPFTQISTSFLILSYNANEKVSGCTHVFKQFPVVHLQIRLVSGRGPSNTAIQYSTDIKFICVPFDHRVLMQLCRSSILAIVPLLYGLLQHTCHLGQKQLWVGRWLWPVQSTFELQNLERIERRACGLLELSSGECTVSGRGQTLTVRRG